MIPNPTTYLFFDDLNTYYRKHYGVIKYLKVEVDLEISDFVFNYIYIHFWSSIRSLYKVLSAQRPSIKCY